MLRYVSATFIILLIFISSTIKEYHTIKEFGFKFWNDLDQRVFDLADYSEITDLYTKIHESSFEYKHPIIQFTDGNVTKVITILKNCDDYYGCMRRNNVIVFDGDQVFADTVYSLEDTRSIMEKYYYNFEEERYFREGRFKLAFHILEKEYPIDQFQKTLDTITAAYEDLCVPYPLLIIIK